MGVDGLSASLFGGFELSLEEQPLPTIRGETARSLFAFIITYHPRQHVRDLLAGKFWPDLPNRLAHRRLSQNLWLIRRSLPAEFLHTPGDTIGIDPAISLTSDFKEFNVRASRYLSGGRSYMADGLYCLDLYKGEFLEGIYADWLVIEREAAHEQFSLVLSHLIQDEKSLGNYSNALAHARRLVKQDPWLEENHREVMRLYHLLGRDTDAMRQFEACSQILRSDYGSDPEAETTALASEIAAQSSSSAPYLPYPSPRLRSPNLEKPHLLPLVGRRSSLATLLRHLEAAMQGAGSLIIVSGEAGIGKSRLARELIDNATWRGLRTLLGRCYELSTPLAYQPLVEALRGGLQTLSTENMGQLWHAELARILPEIDSGESVLPGLSPDEERRRLLESIVRGFEALTKETSCLVVIEDVQWIDTASLDALRYLVPRLGNLRLLFVLTIRQSETTDTQMAVISSMQNTHLAGWIDLKALEPEESQEMIGRLLGLERPAPVFSERLHRDTGGNPFYIIELIWTLIEQGILYRDGSGIWSTPWDRSTQNYDELPLPRSIVQSIELRLDRLPEYLRQFLELAAVIGKEIDINLWCQSSRKSNKELLAVCDDLCDRGLLISVGDDLDSGEDFRSGQLSQPHYTFTHDQIRRVIYNRLTSVRRADLHRIVAETILRYTPRNYELTAYHSSKAGAWDLAVQSHRKAGERARAVHANHEALAHFIQAINALMKIPEPDLDLLFELHEAREALLALLGQRAEQIQELARLAELAEALADTKKQAQVALKQARFSEAVGDYPAAFSAAEKATSLAQELSDVGLRAAALQLGGLVLWRQGNFIKATELLSIALELARSAGLRPVEADCLRDLGRISFHQSDFEKARSYYLQALNTSADEYDCERKWNLLNYLGLLALHSGYYNDADQYFMRALSVCREIGGRRGEGMVLNNLGLLSRRRSDYSSAKSHHLSALEISREIGDRWNVGQILNNLGIASLVQGDYSSARTFFEETLEIWRELGNQHGAGGALANLGCLDRQLGRYDDAKEELRNSLEIFTQLGDRRIQCVVSNDLCLVHFRHGEYFACLNLSSRALEIAENLNNLPLQAGSLINIAHARLALGQLDLARATFQRAAEIRGDLNESHLVMEALAGLAQAALQAENLPESKRHVEDILEFLKERDLEGCEEPFWIYLICIKVLRSLNDSRAAPLLLSTYTLLEKQANQIADECLRLGFLRNVLVNREINTLYEEHLASLGGNTILGGCPEIITRKLPGTGAPTGRPLREDEYVTVCWTITSPEDLFAADKTAARRGRISRLLREASLQGAAPRLADLAEVLGVSMRTLSRDVAALGAQGCILPTRNQKMAGRSRQSHS